MTPTIRVGETVRLVDSRGCWRLHKVRSNDHVQGASLNLSEPVWSRMTFTALRHDGEHLVLTSQQPAIGGRDAKWSPLFLPGDWCAPAGLDA